MNDRTDLYNRLRQAYEVTFTAAQALDYVNRAAVIHVVATSSRSAADRLLAEGGASGRLGNELTAYADMVARRDPVIFAKKRGPMIGKVAGMLGVTGKLALIAGSIGALILLALQILRTDTPDALLALPGGAMLLLLRAMPAIGNGIKSTFAETMQTTAPAKNLLSQHLDVAERDFFAALGVNTPSRWELHSVDPAVTVVVATVGVIVTLIILAMIVSSLAN